MGRLTEKDTSDRWQVKGIPWEKMKAGETITKETSQILYGCLCKLKDYEDTGMNPDQLENLQYELEDVATHVCDKLCRYPWEITEQEELDEICEVCPFSVFVRHICSRDEENRKKVD